MQLANRLHKLLREKVPFGASFCYYENMSIIIDTSNRKYIDYKKIFFTNGRGAHNGAYYYSKEIVKNIIPNVSTDRPWDTLGMKAVGSKDHAIVFIHTNVEPAKQYAWLERYNDLILVVSSDNAYNWAKSAGYKTIFLPLSVDTEYVSKFRTEKTKESCYAGNKWRFKDKDLKKYVPDDVDYPPADIEREELLKFIAPYKKCYCIGRCAIEAQVLGCEVLKCDRRYEPDYFKVLDNRDAAKILQRELDKIK